MTAVDPPVQEEPRQFPFRRECPYDPPSLLRQWHDGASVSQIDRWDGGPVWIATGHDECRTIFRDPRTFSSDPGQPGFPTLSAADQASKGARLLSMLDPPDHDRLRRAVQGEFTVRRINEQRAHTLVIVDELLDAMAATGPPVDLVEAFAQQVPARFTCRLLGVPITDAPFFNDCLGTRFDASAAQTSVYSSDERLAAYFDDVVASRRRGPRDDLSGRLVADHVLTGNLTEREAASLLHVLLIGGFDTTRNMIAMSTVLFADHADALVHLRADPSLWPAAIEELLRYLSVAQYERRAVMADAVVGGAQLRTGDGVLTILHVANRDPAAFADPDRFDITRSDNNHLAFGSGIHQCLGQPVARMLLQVALPKLHERLPGLGLAVPREQVEYLEGRTIWGPRKLPVTW
jgi:pentalenic acid synthase